MGSELGWLLPSFGQLTTLGREQLDLSRPADIRRILHQLRPSLVVNAAAYTAVDKAEREEALAHAINAQAPAVIAEESKIIGAFLVHYSTDYVFDGMQKVPYKESDPTNPLGAYGRTKLAGELAIRASGVPHFIFRTSWVYDRGGKNFLLTILRLASEREELRVVNDQVGAPTWSRDIAAATVRIIESLSPAGTRLSFEGLARHSGTYHMSAAGENSWYDFAVAILDECSRVHPKTEWFAAATGGHPLITKRVIPITTADYPTPARRPAYSVLSNHLFLQTFGFSLQDWRAQLSRVFQAST